MVTFHNAWISFSFTDQHRCYLLPFPVHVFFLFPFASGFYLLSNFSVNPLRSNWRCCMILILSTSVSERRLQCGSLLWQEITLSPHATTPTVWTSLWRDLFKVISIQRQLSSFKRREPVIFDFPRHLQMDNLIWLWWGAQLNALI